MVDPLALVALVVSLVALLVTALQMAQQYAATADDYRRCSERTMGNWVKYTHRRWIWNEFRFEVTFSTPRISCAPPSTDFKDPPPDFEPENSGSKPPSPRVKSSVLISEAPIEVEEQYQFVRVPKRRDAYGLRAEKGKRGNRWYLDGSKAVAEGKCSWLTLLEDTIFTDARITIREIRSSFDFVPPGITKPLAFAEKNSLLTLMSLFGIKWKNRGEQRELSGAGDFCELIIKNSLDFKDLYIYSSRRKVDDWSGQPLPGKQKYYLLSERARKAMFHCFDLEFATFLTHSADEITTSMKVPSLHLDSEDVDRVAAFYRGSNEWCPGLSESITCWAVQSMPKMVEKENDKFKSVFSAISAISLTTGRSKFVNILLGGDTSRNTIPAIRELADWASEYWLGSSINPLHMESVIEGLKYAASSDVYQNISDREIPWTTSRICLKGVRFLDDDLDGRLLGVFTNEDRRSIKSLISKQQIKYGSQLFHHASEAARAEGSFWVNELDRVGAKNYISIASDITEKVGNLDAKLARMIVVNRLMRGSLWVIHNGNAPNQGDRRLECSLSSTWLLDNSTVYIT